MKGTNSLAEQASSPRRDSGKVKVCVLTSVHPPFDPRIFYKEAKSLLEAGYRVTLVAPADFQERVVDGVRVLGLPRYKSRAYRPLNCCRILRIALNERADIYHFHDPDLLPAGVLIRLLTGRPVIYDVHENYVEDILTKPWIPKPVRKVVSLAFGVLEAASVRLVDGVIVVNEQLAKRFSALACRTVVLYNFPRREAFTQDLGEREATDKVIIQVGRLSPERGLWILLEGLRTVTKSHSDLQLLLLGLCSSGEVERQMADKIGEYGLEGNVKWLGYVPHSEICRYLHQAWIGLIPLQPSPQYLQAIPTKMFEYMASGLPIVASDLPLTRRFIEEVGCGLLVTPTDPKAHAEAISYLLDHSDEARRMGENGLRAVVEQYNWEVEQKKLIRLYSELLRQ